MSDGQVQLSRGPLRYCGCAEQEHVFITRRASHAASFLNLPNKMTVNAATVDPHSRCSTAATIYKDENDLRWTYMLNLTDITFGTYG